MSEKNTKRMSADDTTDGKTNGNLICVAAVALFALSFPVAEILLDKWGVLPLLAFRNVLGFLILFLACLYLSGWRRLVEAPWLKGIAIGALGFGVGSTLLLLAQSDTNAVTAALAAAAMPVAGVGLEVILDGRRINTYFLTGSMLVIAGSLIAIGMEITDASFGFGAMLGLLSTVLFAWGSRATVKSLGATTDLIRVIVTVAGMTLFSIGVYVLFSTLGICESKTQLSSLDVPEWGYMLVYAVLALAVSQLLWIKGVNKIGIGIASFHLNAVPFYVMLILYGLGAAWNWHQAFGAMVLAIGVVLAQKKPRAFELVRHP